MNIAIISLTESGREISEKVFRELEGTDGNAVRYCFYRHIDENAESFTELSGIIKDIFTGYEAIVFICSVGIAVRSIAPYVASKLTDPAVIAADDGGKFAVSLLSGHIGGANALTERIAGITGAVPVITTSTDVHDRISPDMLAKKNNLVICDMKAAKKIAAAVLDGEKTGFICEYPHSPLPPELSQSEDCSTGICISGNAGEKPFETTLNLLPKNLVVGIGCKKGTDSDTILNHIMSVFSDNKLDIRRIFKIVTIDIKKNEPGIIEFCGRFSLPLMVYTAQELMSVQGGFDHSDFVEQTTGADNVCERACVCAGGRIIVPKTAGRGVTVAVGECGVYIEV